MARLTEKNNGNGNQDHKNVMITDERYQTLNADGKANTRSHGFLWNVLSCLDNDLRPAGGRPKEVGGMQMGFYTMVPGSCRLLSRVLTRGMWRFGLPER